MSTPRLESCVPLPLEDDVLEEIVNKATDWALMHGAAMRSKDNFSKDLLQLAPFVLLPSPFPRKEFEKAVAIQPILNELMHKVAHSHEFLVASLKSTIEVDEFTRKLFEIYETVNSEGISQTFQLGLFRSDYFADSAANFGIKQVEFNTIASSFGGIATNISQYNRYVLQELGHDDKVKNLPTNGALQGICEALAEAWTIYADLRAVVMIVVENVTYNICDQRFHEFEIRELHPEIRVIRKTLTEIGEQGKLGPMKELIIKDDVVSVVYYRSGYEPGQYPSQLEWEARLLVERSRAIKSPSIQYHLAGTKKVQQALARPGAVEKFLTELHQVEVVREIFTGLYSLDFDKFGEEAIQLALANPDKFVLKPQREGGGNNVYGEKVREELLAMKDSKERTAWILMDRISPPIQTCYIVRPGQDGLPPLSDLVSELGIFGVILGDKDNIFVNKQVGHMLRTKLSSADEGGVAAGSGALDSPYLIDAVVTC